MTPSEIVAFCRDRIHGTRRGMTAAQSTGNYQLAALNCRQAFKHHLMISLINWRTGTNPSDSLAEMLQGFAKDWATVATIGGNHANISDVPAELVGFAAYLTDQPCSIFASPEGLESDRLLDFVLGTWLFDSWNDAAWELGMKQFRRAGSKLAVETYQLYKSITEADVPELSELAQAGERLFAMRKSDAFFSGGDQTEGGGEDNNITVDYRLAALLKRAGFKESSGVHLWKW